MYCTCMLVVIGLAAFATSVLSAVAGLGGGIILLATLAQFFAPTVAIPIHGGIQMASNSSRAVILRRDIRWPPVLWGSALLLPASIAGVAVATSVPESLLRAAMGAFVLVVVWRPSLLKWRGSQRLPDRAMLGVGAASGFLSATVGASGPVTSPFYKAVTASHVSFVATAAATQVIAHASKLTAFAMAEFDVAAHLDVIGVGVVGVVVGTRLLGRVADVHLDRLFRVVLTVLGLRLIIQAIS